MNKPATWLDVMSVGALLLTFIVLQPYMSDTERLTVGVISALISLILCILNAKKVNTHD